MNYLEAIEAVKQNPENSFIGIFIRPGNTEENWYFGYYKISIVDQEDPEWISIWFEGGIIFDELYEGEEEAYCLESVPDEAKNLYYKSADLMPEIEDMTSEYALFEIFPDLPDPEELWTSDEISQFVQLANERVKQWAA